MSQSHSSSTVRERAGSGAIPRVVGLSLKQFSTGVWGLVPDVSPDAVIVESSPGVYTIVAPTTTPVSIVRAGIVGIMT